MKRPSGRGTPVSVWVGPRDFLMDFFPVSPIGDQIIVMQMYGIFLSDLQFGNLHCFGLAINITIPFSPIFPLSKISRARKSTQESPLGFNVPFSPTETESWTKICRSENDGKFSRQLCHLGSGQCRSDACQCLPDVAGLNIPTDAERFSLGQLLCSGLLVFGIVFGGW